MPKIQNVGVGNFIRDPRGSYGKNSRQMNVQILKIDSNQGGSFLCYPVKKHESNVTTLDYSSHQFILIDTEVDQVFP